MMNSFRLRSIASLGLLGAALLCVVALGANDRIADPCVDPEAQSKIMNLAGTETARRAARKPGASRLLSVHGTLSVDTERMIYSVIRSGRALDLSADALAGVKLPMTPTREWVEEVVVDGEPVELAWAEQPYPDGRQIVGYVLFLGNELNQHPLEWLARTAVTQLRRGTIPATLYRVEGAAAHRHVSELAQNEANWLRAAIQHHRATCGRS